MKTIILFEFEGAYASKIMNVHDKYKNVRFSGESFKVNERTIHLFDELVKRVFSHPDELAIAFVSDRTIADKVFSELTSLENAHLPIIRIESKEMKNLTIERLSKSCDQIVWVGPNAQIDGDFDCQITSIMTEFEMKHESWMALTTALKSYRIV